MSRVVVLRGELFKEVRSAEQQERDEWQIDEKKDGPVYRDDAWSVSFHWLDGEKENVMFSGSTFTIDADIIDAGHRDKLLEVGFVYEGPFDDGEVFASEPDHIAHVPQYITDRLVDEGYRLFPKADPFRCPQCGHDEFLARFDQPEDPVDHVVLSRWQCKECSAPIAFDRREEPACPRDESADVEEIYGETKDSYRHLGHCPECEAERMIFETVSNDDDVCLTCGASVPDDGDTNGEEVGPGGGE